MTDHIHATSSHLNDAILRSEQAGNFGHATLLRAVRNRQIRLVFVGRDTLVGDDDYAGTGLAGFRSWRRLQSWARCGLVHAAAADGTYALAVTVATTQGKRFPAVSGGRFTRLGCVLMPGQV